MSINLINQSLAMISCKCEELRTSTKLRLEALGIDPSNVKTEAQAQILIAQAEASSKQNNSGKENPSKHQLILETKQLAQKVGADYSEKSSLEENLENISKRIQILLQDPQKHEDAKIYQEELENIAKKADVAMKIQKNIFDNMNMISISNKILFGIN